jgi:hypothetical protein
VNVAESWPSGSPAENNLRDKAIAVYALMNEVGQNTAYRNFANAIPEHANDNTIRLLVQVMLARRWDIANPSSIKVVESLVSAYVRASPKHSAVDLLNPMFGDGFGAVVFPMIFKQGGDSKQRIAQKLATTEGNLSDKDHLMWLIDTAGWLSSLYSDGFNVDDFMPRAACENDFQRYMRFYLMEKRGLKFSLERDEAEYFYEKYGNDGRFLNFFLTAVVVKDGGLKPLMKRIISDIIKGAPDVDRESALYGILGREPARELALHQ